MRKLFEKHETPFCILIIVIYLVSNSVCIRNFGNTSPQSFALNTVLSLLLTGLTAVLKRTEYYGLTKVRNIKNYLCFIPLAAIVSVNLWNGININNSVGEIVFHILTMINIGFIEEIIFRGYLFKMMLKNNVKCAVFISAVTFGAGHIVNLFSGAEIIPTLLQVCYAASVGYLFVVIFQKSQSLVPCIITHCLVNSLSVFNVENTVSLYIAPVFLTIVPLVYAFYIKRKAAENL